MNETKEPVVMPVCPFCKSTMLPKYFTGYYESFSMWECGCLEIPGAITEHGSYA
jgi:hypothetical protein